MCAVWLDWNIFYNIAKPRRQSFWCCAHTWKNSYSKFQINLHSKSFTFIQFLLVKFCMRLLSILQKKSSQKTSSFNSILHIYSLVMQWKEEWKSTFCSTPWRWQQRSLVRRFTRLTIFIKVFFLKWYKNLILDEKKVLGGVYNAKRQNSENSLYKKIGV